MNCVIQRLERDSNPTTQPSSVETKIALNSSKNALLKDFEVRIALNCDLEVFSDSPFVVRFAAWLFLAQLANQNWVLKKTPSEFAEKASIFGIWNSKCCSLSELEVPKRKKEFRNVIYTFFRAYVSIQILYKSNISGKLHVLFVNVQVETVYVRAFITWTFRASFHILSLHDTGSSKDTASYSHSYSFGALHSCFWRVTVALTV